jgi:hypothetical protein
MTTTTSAFLKKLGYKVTFTLSTAFTRWATAKNGGDNKTGAQVEKFQSKARRSITGRITTGEWWSGTSFLLFDF